MPETTSKSSRQLEPDTVKSIWRDIRAQLEGRKSQTLEEIQNYPPPIPACDQHFNYLLAERDNLGRELRRLEAYAKESLTGQDAGQLIDEFVQSSTYIGDDAKQKIRAAL